MWRKLAQNWVLPFLDPRRIASVVRLPGFFTAWIDIVEWLVGAMLDLRICGPV